MIRWGIRIAVLLVLLVGVDRLAVGIVEGQMASKLQSAESLQKKPSVHIGGFPFLTQVVSGSYGHVTVDVHGLTRDGLEVSNLDVDAHGIKIAFGDAVSGKVRDVPVTRGTVRATVAYAALDKAFSSYGGGVVSVRTSSAGQGKVRLDGAVNLPGGPYRISGVAAMSLTAGKLKVTPAPTLFALLPAVVAGQVTRLLSPVFVLPALPFGITLDSAEVDSDGVVLVASAKGIVLHTSG